MVGAARSSNLDALLELRNGAGELLASGNPLDALGASISVRLPSAGTYYRHVRGVGRGDPLVDGYSSYGSVGQYALNASVVAASGAPPTAVMTATPTSGTIALVVNFSSAGSSDSDGSIVAYDWSFGDGATASGASPSHSYTTAGSYSAQLRLTDNSGMSSTRAVTINATSPVMVMTMRVSDIGMSLRLQKNGLGRAAAAVSVLNSNGQPVAGATVNGAWSGVVSGNASASSASNGVASFTSPSTRANGSFNFTVTGITLAGHQYQSALNTETSDATTR